MITLEHFSAGFGDTTIVSDVSFEIGDTGVVALLGPGGVGKTTLLRSLARWNESIPSYWSEGDIRLDGASLLRDMSAESAHHRVPMLAQKAHLYTASVLDNAIDSVRPKLPLSRGDELALAREVLEPAGLWNEFEILLDAPVLDLSIGRQRRLSLARLSRYARCLLVDEPLRDLAEDEAEAIALQLERTAVSKAILLVTHDQRVARKLSDHVCLMTAGNVVEFTPTEQFFTTPQTQLGRDYIRSGNCWPKEIPEKVQSGGVQLPTPGGFHWVLPGLLGGMQRPGLMGEEEYDLDALSQLQCSILVTLTEEPYEADLHRWGIRGVHFPIADMQAPTLANAHLLCQQISRWIDRGTPTVVHCKAGLGRTGTMLACVLVHRGHSAVHAVEEVRSINPFYIQSVEQLKFISLFHDYLHARTQLHEP